MTSLLKKILSRVWLPFVLSRLWVALWVYIGHAQHPYRISPDGGNSGVDNWWLNPWTTYDTHWFMRIAQHGYEPQTATFFPLYPMLLRVGGSSEIGMALCGVVLSNVAFFCGLLALHRLTELDYDQKVATRAVWLLAFSPLAAVFSAVYTDALFGALLVFAFLCVRRERWVGAGVFAALASMTRNSGPVIVVALFIEWLRSTRHAATEGRKRPSLLWVLLPLAAFLAVQVYVASQVRGLSAITGHGNYGRALTWPWLPLWHDVYAVATLNDTRLITILGVAVTIATFALAWKYRARQPLSYAVLIVGVMMMQLLFGRTFAPYTNSSLRFMSGMFPFVQLLALAVEPLMRNRLRLGLSATIYLLLCALISWYFGQKQFVTG
jgi:hypothetical protein